MSRTRTGYCFFGIGSGACRPSSPFRQSIRLHAAERKSIRWATSSTGSYGYKVAAQMVQVLEDRARRRVHRHGQSVSFDDRCYEGDNGRQRGDRLHGRRRDDRGLRRHGAPSKITNPPSRRWSTPGMRTRWSHSWPSMLRRQASSSPGATSAASRYSSPPPVS